VLKGKPNISLLPSPVQSAQQGIVIGGIYTDIKDQQWRKSRLPGVEPDCWVPNNVLTIGAKTGWEGNESKNKATVSTTYVPPGYIALADNPNAPKIPLSVTFGREGWVLGDKFRNTQSKEWRKFRLARGIGWQSEVRSGWVPNKTLQIGCANTGLHPIINDATQIMPTLNISDTSSASSVLRKTI
jgi:hypothetical protein